MMGGSKGKVVGTDRSELATHLALDWSSVPSDMPALDQCNPLTRTPRAPPTRPHACLPVRPVGPVGRSLARPPSRPPTRLSQHAQKAPSQSESAVAQPSLARACSRAPRTTRPRCGPPPCVPTRILPCTCSPVCPPFNSVPARPPENTKVNGRERKEGGGGGAGARRLSGIVVRSPWCVVCQAPQFP